MNQFPIFRFIQAVFIIIIGGCIVIIIGPGGPKGPIGPEPDQWFNVRLAAVISLAASVLGFKAVRDQQIAQERLS